MAQYCAGLREASGDIRLPGEGAAAAARYRKAEGIPLPDSLAAEMKELFDKYSVDFD
eukprot:gene9398-8421_t